MQTAHTKHTFILTWLPFYYYAKTYHASYAGSALCCVTVSVCKCSVNYRSLCCCAEAEGGGGGGGEGEEYIHTAAASLVNYYYYGFVACCSVFVSMFGIQ